MTSGFIGCLRDFRLKGKRIGKWSNNHRSGVKPCSEKVETGTFIGPEGGFIHAFKKFRVGLDFDITMKIKPRRGILTFIILPLGSFHSSCEEAKCAFLFKLRKEVQTV